jgi:F-type H+-transporting ATPase subunit alpha
MDVVDQVIVIYAANQGFLNNVPVREVQNWEKQFLQFLREQRAQVRANLAEKKELTPEIVAEIEGALNAFKTVYKPGA